MQKAAAEMFRSCTSLTGKVPLRFSQVMKLKDDFSVSKVDPGFEIRSYFSLSFPAMNLSSVSFLRLKHSDRKIIPTESFKGKYIIIYAKLSRKSVKK